MEQVRRRFEKVGPAEGIVRIDTVSMRGPVLQPSRWQFRLTGEMENVFLRPAGLPGPVEAKTGRFEASQDRLSFTDLHARSLDASLVVSGSATQYIEGPTGSIWH